MTSPASAPEAKVSAPVAAFDRGGAEQVRE
jgi:hypothetical protein